jgi:DNA (cytosine-5)-methyltransferase 1
MTTALAWNDYVKEVKPPTPREEWKKLHPGERYPSDKVIADDPTVATLSEDYVEHVVDAKPMSSDYQKYYMKDVYDGEAKEKFTVISTFAGGGGSSTGYRLAGGKILCINEFVKEARNTYHENYPNTPIDGRDIKELHLEGEHELLDAANIGAGEVDLLDGSPPCSAFSMAGAVVQGGGHSSGFGKTKNYSDGKKVENIEDLFFEFIRVAKDIQPKVIVAENVSGLLMGEAKKYYSHITAEFESFGYYASPELLNSSHFGVPQTRKRVIFIAVRGDVADAIKLSRYNIDSIFPQKTTSIPVTCGNAFSDLEYDEEEIKKLTETFVRGSHFETASRMPLDPKKVLTGCDYNLRGHHFNMKRLSRFKPSPTITASGGCIHWSEMRKLALCETRRAMSLPEDFKLTGKWEQRSERMGRMVPPLMMKAIADSIYKKVLKPYKELNND